jgi:hypothetical protein
MNIPNTIIKNASSRFGAMRSDAGAALAGIAAGVVATADDIDESRRSNTVLVILRCER